MSSTRHKLIQLLSEAEDTYISGQRLSEQLNISRNAVWKHMNELKKDGYEIEGKAKLGYKIISYPNKMSENTVSWGLDTDWLGRKIVHLEKTTSTQRIAHDLALDNAKHGTIVIADEQTEGKGRVGRQWQSEEGKGIWMSIILRPDILPFLAPQLTLLTATVLAEVIDEHSDVTPQIKWPNDILIEGKKLSGILTEMQAEQDKVSYVIVGIGMNVNQDASDFTPEVASRATSLKIKTNKTWDMVRLTQLILQKFETKYNQFMDHGFQDVKKKWESYGFRMNEQLQIKTGNVTWTGLFSGIAEDGALLIDTNGSLEKIYSGEIAWFEGGN